MFARCNFAAAGTLRVDDEHRPLHVGADSISVRKIVRLPQLFRANNVCPYKSNLHYLSGSYIPSRLTNFCSISSL